MNLVKINLYAIGYYSKAIYDEVIYLLEEDYKKLNVDLYAENFTICDLDGKYSETDGDLYIEIINEDMQENYNFKKGNTDDNVVRYRLEDKYEEDTIREMIRKAKDYIDNLDSLADVKFEVKKSQVKEIIEYLDKTLVCYGMGMRKDKY